MKLNEASKQKLEQQVQKISARDESEVEEKILNELQKLDALARDKSSDKLQELVKHASLLHEILKEIDFPLSPSSRKWIVFGLRYLISGIDLIPDGIPGIGYNDDAMIIQWVINVIDKDIERYHVFKEVSSLVHKGQVSTLLQAGSEDQVLILLPGMVARHTDEELMEKWQTQLHTLPRFKHSEIRVIQHNFNHLSELSQTLKVVDHDLKLKPIYDIEAFQVDWEQAKQECNLLGAALHRELEQYLKESPQKKISLLCMDLGSRMASSLLAKGDNLNVERIYSMGGSSCHHSKGTALFDGVSEVYNFYSETDYALKFIFDTVEKQAKPIGMMPLMANSKQKIENINVSKEVKNHFEYKYKMHLLLAPVL